MNLAGRVNRFDHNFAYNSDAGIWQRGTSETSTSSDDLYYAADRWGHRFEASSGTIDNLYSRVEDAPAGTPFRYALRVEAQGSAASSTVLQNSIRQTYEKQDARLILQDGEFTYGFWYKSNVTGSHTCTVDLGPGFNGATTFYEQTFDVDSADTWVYYQITFSGINVTQDPTVAEFNAGIILSAGPKQGTGGITDWDSGDYFQMVGMQVKRGAEAPQNGWNLQGISPAQEFSLCQRYYEECALNASLHEQISFASWPINFMVQKRATPSLGIVSGGFSAGSTLLENASVRGFRLTVSGNPPEGTVIAGGIANADAEFL